MEISSRIPYNYSYTDKTPIILLDIEGTTTSISFVKDKLFPYARENALQHLTDTWSSEETQQAVKDLTLQIAEDVKNGVAGAQDLPPTPQNDNEKGSFIEALYKNITSMMDADRKIGPLKNIQGQIWQKAYRSGKLKGHVYEDALRALETWKTSGKRLFIYSSGSVEAQKLLFKYSDFGDLLYLFEGHFDTKIGLKVEENSYHNIRKEIEVPAENILFITDLVKEARAAKTAGFGVILSRRPGTVDLGEEDLKEFPVVDSFDEFFPPSKGASQGTKRKFGDE